MHTYENMARQECTEFSCFAIPARELKERAARGDRAAIAELARRAHNRAEKYGEPAPRQARPAPAPAPYVSAHDQRISDYMKLTGASIIEATYAIRKIDMDTPARRNGYSSEY